MTILDATIVNVALPTLGRDFSTSISTIQWVPTIYLPVGQAILAQAAGPQRMGRVMSIVGVPLLLGPIIGPVIGGAIVGSASWRWIFFVNLPVGAVALALALWLSRSPRR